MRIQGTLRVFTFDIIRYQNYGRGLDAYRFQGHGVGCFIGDFCTILYMIRVKIGIMGIQPGVI